jgi:RNA polymerase sigma factor (sigma-70 family)
VLALRTGIEFNARRVGTSDLPDDVLVQRCRRGDEEAWQELVTRFSRYVHAIAVGVYRLAPADAEDVFQETFARAYEHLDRLRDPGAVRPWLAQLTRRLCVDRLRAGRREDLPGDVVEHAEVDARLERLEEALAVRAALAQLTPECAEILDRFFARDESYRTISAALDLPAGTIASRISRCLNKLRLFLEQEDNETFTGAATSAGT